MQALHHDLDATMSPIPADTPAKDKVPSQAAPADCRIQAAMEATPVAAFSHAGPVLPESQKTSSFWPNGMHEKDVTLTVEAASAQVGTPTASKSYRPTQHQHDKQQANELLGGKSKAIPIAAGTTRDLATAPKATVVREFPHDGACGPEPMESVPLAERERELSGQIRQTLCKQAACLAG